MNVYFAPLEGITGYIYRNAFHEFFDPGIEKYFTPFIAISQNGLIRNRETSDLSPEHNREIKIVPQLLGNNGKVAAQYIKTLGEMGFSEVNLNLGCPYQTVVSKHKGAGLLEDTNDLKAFLEEIFESAQIGVSVKTRIGMEQAWEFEDILAVYNSFPLSELIVHPRVRTDFYGNHPDRSAFAYALANSKAPVCYNGDLFSEEDFKVITEHFPETKRVMLGRGLIANPGLLKKIFTGEELEKERLRAFHDRILEGYLEVMCGDKNTLFKMKELWNYMQFLFEGSEKQIKKIRKAQRLADYENAVDRLFMECPFRSDGRFLSQS